MPKYHERSLSGNKNDTDIHFTAEEIPGFESFGTNDRFYRLARMSDVQKGNYPRYGVRVDTPWKLAGFTPANGWMYYRFTQDDESDDPKWAAMKVAAMLGANPNEYFSPERIAATEALHQRGGGGRALTLDDMVRKLRQIAQEGK